MGDISAIALSVQFKTIMVIIDKKRVNKPNVTEHLQCSYNPNVLEEDLSRENQMPKMVLPWDHGLNQVQTPHQVQMNDPCSGLVYAASSCACVHAHVHMYADAQVYAPHNLGIAQSRDYAAHSKNPETVCQSRHCVLGLLNLKIRGTSVQP